MGYYLLSLDFLCPCAASSLIDFCLLSICDSWTSEIRRKCAFCSAIPCVRGYLMMIMMMVRLPPPSVSEYLSTHGGAVCIYK